MPDKRFSAATDPYAGDVIVIVPPGTEATATAQSGKIFTGTAHTLRLDSTVTALAGTSPTVTVTIETSTDGTTWVTLGSAFTQQSTTNSLHKVFSGLDRYVRANYAITGSAGQKVTFGVTGEIVG